jgi:hypothetical protein
MTRASYGLIGFLALTSTLGALILAPASAHAALPELRITPLRYDQHLELGRLQTGVIDASNPTGSPVHVVFQVQAFRQTGDRGELEYYNDERIASAITPAVPEFDLGPREAVRTRFTIDPNRLGPGGSYAVIFLRTIDPKADPGQINTSARVGTLLILDVGTGGTRTGRLSGLAAPSFIYGRTTLEADYNYTNTGTGPQALAFAPVLETALGPDRERHDGRFVFPGRTRSSHSSLALGSHLGPATLTVRDLTGGSAPATRRVFLVTGYWTWLLPLLAALILVGFTPLRWWKNSPRFFHLVPRLKKD